VVFWEISAFGGICAYMYFREIHFFWGGGSWNFEFVVELWRFGAFGDLGIWDVKTCE